MIKLEIEINEHTARYFRSMASMGRFIDSLARVLERCEDQANSDELIDDIEFNLDNLKEAKPAIEEIGRVLRNKLIEADIKPLWNQN